MFELLPWNPMLETGIAVIDAQHRRLVEILNRLALLYAGDPQHEALGGVLDALTDYAMEHFDTEEALWKSRLPADGVLYVEHHAEHQGFCTRVTAARAQLDETRADNDELTRELLLFLSGWLAEHILQSDRRMALVVQRIERGETLEAATASARAELAGAGGLLVRAALDMYKRLSRQTLELMTERQQRTEAARVLASLQLERERQSLAVSLAGMLLVSDADSLQADLDTLMRRIAQTLGADRCVLRLFSADRRQAQCRAEWCAPGVPSVMAAIPTLEEGKPLRAWIERLGMLGEMRIADTRDLPEWALQGRAIFQSGLGRSLCAVSLRHGGTFLGWLAVHMADRPRHWSDEEVQWLQLLASQLGSSLLRQRAEQRASTLLAAVPAGVAAASIEHRRLLFCNDAFCTLMRAPREELLGMDVTELHPPGEAARVAQEFAALAARGAQPMLTIEVCRPDGSRFLAEITQTTLELDSGPVALAVFTDITRRNAAEAALKASEQQLEQQVRTRTAELAEANRRLEQAGERMRALLDLSRRLHLLSEPELLEAGLELAVQLTGSRDGYLHFLSATDGRIELFAWAAASRAACRAEVPGHYPLEQAGIWADAARLRVPLIHNDFAAEPHRRGMPEGHIPLQRHLCVPVLDGDAVRMLVGVGNKAEPYDAHDSDQLQLVANDLWGLLLRHRAQAALAAARDAAEQNSRAKSAFLANMSHEIRTPLNAVIGFAQVLGRDDSLGVRQREQVQIIARSGEHLLQLLNDVLDLSKIEAGQLKLSAVQFSPALLLDEVARLYLPRAQERGLRFSLEGLQDLPGEVSGDVIKLRQIVLNLLGNALKFTLQGGITLRAAVSRASADRWLLQIEVIDTGPGISAEEQARLFKPFQQGIAGERMGSGTGLGLSISRRLAALMGGTLDLRSAPGQGSCFRLELPLADVLVMPDVEVSTPIGAEPAAGVLDLQGLDPALRKGMQEALHAGDMARLRALVDALPADAGRLATGLRGLIQRYDYERLEALLQ